MRMPANVEVHLHKRVPWSVSPSGLREMAARARRLASATLDELIASKLTEFAKEVEASSLSELVCQV